ncbi:MAG: hypothetical protein H0X24_22940 [Ktedonobacterales bacterium]|nr:hypothetical protein [Ktedonobacterales bacterium]
MQHSRFVRGACILTLMGLFTLAGCQSLSAPGGTSGTTPTVTTTGTPVTPTPTGGTGGQPFASLLIADTASTTAPLLIENVNPTSGRRVQVASIPAGTPSKVQAISPNGQLVAYTTTASGSGTTLSVADIGALTPPVAVAQNIGTLSNAVWQHDNAHVAVVSGRQLLIFSITGQAAPSVAFPAAASLLGFAPDDQSIFFTAADAPGLASGALYRLPLADPTHPLQVTPRESGSHFVLSRDGQSVYFDNTATTGGAGIYRVATQTANATPQLLVTGAGNYPLGFSAAGDLLFAAAQTLNPALKAVNTAGTVTTVVAKLVDDPAQVRYPNQQITLAPDGTGIAVVTPLGTSGSEIFATDLTASSPAPKVTLTLPGAPRVDLAGWDIVLVAGAS